MDPNHILHILKPVYHADFHSNSERSRIPPPQVLPTVINRRGRALCPEGSKTKRPWYHNRSVTILHVAVYRNLDKAVDLLVERGAEVDAQDSRALTPLAYATTRQMAEKLLRLGASPTALLRLTTSITSLISWWDIVSVSTDMLSLYCGAGSGIPEWKLDGLFDMNLSGQRQVASCKWFGASPEKYRLLQKLGVDFICEDSCGRSLMHCSMCEDSLPFPLLRVFGLERTTPFPWHLDWISLFRMAFLTSKFAALRRALSFETFHRILNLEPQRGWSPLCRAAANDSVNIIENCLSMNAVIDFEGSHLGSALVVACVCGSLKAVKCLIQHGAAISYTGSGGFVCALTKTRSEAVRAWILVGRFTETLSIADMGCWSRAADCEMEVRPWSGVVQARVRLVGKLEKRLEETSIMYAGRLGQWKKGKWGMVITVSEGLVFPLQGSP